MRESVGVDPVVTISATDGELADGRGEHTRIDLCIARTIAEVEAIRDVWARWKTHRDSDIDYCLGFVWARQTFIRPHVIVISRDGRPDAILVGRVERARMDSKIGYFRIPESPIRLLCVSYRGLLGNGSAENCELFLQSIMESLKRGEADASMLHYALVDSPIYKKALSVPGFAVRDHRPETLPHHALELPTDIDQVYRGLSLGLRGQLRRQQKRIEEEFAGSIEVHCFRDQSGLDYMMSQSEAVAKQTYQRGLGVGFQDSSETRQRLRLCAEKGWLRAYLLRLRGKPCAFFIGTLYEGVYCGDYTGYISELADYSLGSYLLMSAIRELCNDGVKTFDFGPGRAEYKERFGNRVWVESCIYVFAPGLKGFFLNGIRTSTGFFNDTLTRLLDGVNLLPKIKKLWRNVLRASHTEPSS